VGYAARVLLIFVTTVSLLFGMPAVAVQGNDTSALQVTNPGDQENNEGDTVSLQINASDPDGDLLSYNAEGLPADLSIGASTGLISGTLNYESAGTYSANVTVSSSTANVSTTFAWTVIDATPTITVEIDIKPGSGQNSINPSSNGVIPVAILTTDDFDAATVDPDTVLFGPGEAAPVHCTFLGAGNDGGRDMLLHFRTQETGIEAGDTEATLTGKTIDGTNIIGTDSVRTVPPEVKGKGNKDGDSKPGKGKGRGKGKGGGQGNGSNDSNSGNGGGQGNGNSDSNSGNGKGKGKGKGG
jgi:hypothetical protein